MIHFSERYLLPVAIFKMTNSIQNLISNIKCNEKHYSPRTFLKSDAEQKNYHLILYVHLTLGRIFMLPTTS